MPRELAPRVPSDKDLHKEIVKLKKIPKGEPGSLEWMYGVSKCCAQEALIDLDQSYDNAFIRLDKGEDPGFPNFKSRSRNPGHFRVTGQVYVKEGKIHIPRIGMICFMPGDRGYIPERSYVYASIVEDHGRWCVSVTIKLDVPDFDPDFESDPRPVVGCDVGVRDLCHLSDGVVIQNAQALKQEEKRLQKSKLSIARKQRASDKAHGGPRKKGERREESKRLQRARKKAASLQLRVANLRKDSLHKATTFLAKTYKVIVVEDLHGKNMTKRCHGKGRAAKAGLNRAILDSGMLRIQSLLSYKLPLHGGRLIVVPAYYTSRTCSHCGAQNDPGSSKVYKCAKCGLVIDRDRNASLNILKAAASWSADFVSFFGFPESGLKKKKKRRRRGANVRPKAQCCNAKCQTAGCEDPTIDSGCKS